MKDTQPVESSPNENQSSEKKGFNIYNLEDDIRLLNRRMHHIRSFVINVEGQILELHPDERSEIGAKAALEFVQEFGRLAAQLMDTCLWLINKHEQEMKEIKKKKKKTSTKKKNAPQEKE